MPTRWCADCGALRPKETDPRSPPVAVGVCLCVDCAIAAWQEVYDYHEESLDEARANLARLTVGKQP